MSGTRQEEIRMTMIRLAPLLSTHAGTRNFWVSRANQMTAVHDVGTMRGKGLNTEGNPVTDATINVEGQIATATTDGSFEVYGVKLILVYLYLTTPFSLDND